MGRKLILHLCLSSLIFFALSQGDQSTNAVEKKYDSLIHLYKNVHIEPSNERLEVIRPLVSNSFEGRNSLDDRIAYLLDGISILHEWDSTKRLMLGYNSLGHLYWLNGDPDKSIESVYKVAELAKSVNDTYWEANAYANIGASFKLQKNFTEALYHEKKARELYKNRQDTFLLFSIGTGIAETYFKMGKMDSSRMEQQNSLPFFTKKDDYRFQYVYGLWQANQAKLLALEKNYDSAKQLIRLSDEVFTIYQSNSLSQASALNYIEIGSIFLEHERANEAIEFAMKGYEIGVEHQMKEVIQNGSWVLANAYEQLNEDAQALPYFKTYYTYRDSILNVENVKQIESLRADFEINQKQVEVDTLTAQKKNQQVILLLAAVVILVVIVLLVIIIKYYRTKTKTNKLLEEQKAALERLNETKDKFFSIISHDLRGPISSFMGVGKLIRHFSKKGDISQLMEIADEMETSTERLTNLLDSLLSWAMQQQGHFPNVPEKVNLNQMVEDVKGMFSNMADSKNITIASNIHEKIDLWVDRNTTHTILRNLVNNSIKFTPNDGQITIESKMSDDMAIISVTDTGVGMPKEKINKLFRLSAKTSTYGTTGEKGMGLGLQLVKEFIDMNKGFIEVESTEGTGTTFIISFPLFESVKSEVVLD